MNVAADYYDGRHSRPQPVLLAAAAGWLTMDAADGQQRQVAAAQLQITERLGSTPRRIVFADGTFCEVAQAESVQDLLRELGLRTSALERAHDSWSVAAMAIVATAAIFIAGYIWGLPLVATFAAARIPPGLVETLSSQTFEALDRPELMAPSKVPAARQREIRQGLFAMKAPDGGALPAHQILFRSAPVIGANAVALPDGRILLLDELVALADNDAQIYAVLAHELGHVVHRHGLRMLLQGSVVGAFGAWWFGDVSTLLVATPTLLLRARYSRGFEAEADNYAAALLRANGLKPALLAQMLEKLVRQHHAEDSSGSGWLDYASSHPASAERIRLLGDDTAAAATGARP